MKRNSNCRRDYATEQKSRLAAGRLFAKNCTQAEVVRRMKVSRQTASRWYHAWRSGGQDALWGAGRTGRRRKLAVAELRSLEGTLSAGARAQGFRTEMWTLKRIACVVQRQFRVTYHPGHVWKLLGELNWSCQRPEQRARERDEVAIQRWVKQRWPQIKKRLGEPVHG